MLARILSFDKSCVILTTVLAILDHMRYFVTAATGIAMAIILAG